MKTEIHPLEDLNGIINTPSGTFDLLNPLPEMVNINDIALSLSAQPHFNGLSQEVINIAQHSILVCELALQETNDSKLAFAALMHDAAEAYTGDIIKPIKVLWPEFETKIENPITKAIFKKYGIDFHLLKEIKDFDIEVQRREFNQFYRNTKTIVPLSSFTAYSRFKTSFDFFIKNSNNSL